MRGKTPDWTEKEDRLLKEYYGSMKLKELLHVFPDRTENAIIIIAIKIKFWYLETTCSVLEADESRVLNTSAVVLSIDSWFAEFVDLDFFWPLFL